MVGQHIFLAQSIQWSRTVTITSHLRSLSWSHRSLDSPTYIGPQTHNPRKLGQLDSRGQLYNLRSLYPLTGLLASPLRCTFLWCPFGHYAKYSSVCRLWAHGPCTDGSNIPHWVCVHAVCTAKKSHRNASLALMMVSA